MDDTAICVVAGIASDWGCVRRHCCTARRRRVCCTCAGTGAGRCRIEGFEQCCPRLACSSMFQPCGLRRRAVASIRCHANYWLVWRSRNCAVYPVRVAKHVPLSHCPGRRRRVVCLAQARASSRDFHIVMVVCLCSSFRSHVAPNRNLPTRSTRTHASWLHEQASDPGPSPPATAL